MKNNIEQSLNTLKHWQSMPCMIPVVLSLLKEKISYLSIKNNWYAEEIRREIDAYQNIYHYWENFPQLNLKQKEWLQEIGTYLEILEDNSK